MLAFRVEGFRFSVQGLRFAIAVLAVNPNSRLTLIHVNRIMQNLAPQNLKQQSAPNALSLNLGRFPLLLTVLTREYRTPPIKVPIQDCSYQGEDPEP